MDDKRIIPIPLTVTVLETAVRDKMKMHTELVRFKLYHPQTGDFTSPSTKELEARL
jgi:hypothetical protein